VNLIIRAENSLITKNNLENNKRLINLIKLHWINIKKIRNIIR
jgi:hypothetical protein